MVTQLSDPLLRPCFISKHKGLVKILFPMYVQYFNAFIPELYVHELTYQFSLFNNKL